MSETTQDLLSTGAALMEEVQSLLKEGRPHEFSRYLFSRLELTEAKFTNFVDRALASMIAELAQPEPNYDGCLPRISHRVWITDPKNSHLPPQAYLTSIFQQQQEAPSWEHIFWTNSLDVANHVNALAEQQGCAGFCRLLADQFSNDPLYPAIGEFVAASKFVGASDLARIMVIYRLGGLYCDMGVVCSRTFMNLVARSGVTLNVDMQLMFQLAVLAFPAYDPFISLWYQLCRHPGIFAAAVHPVGREFRAIEELSFLSGPGFTAMVLHFLDPSRPVLIIPQQGRFLRIYSQQSWYGTDGKFGNVIVSKTPSTRLLAPAYATWRSILDTLPAMPPQEAIKVLAEISNQHV